MDGWMKTRRCKHARAERKAEGRCMGKEQGLDGRVMAEQRMSKKRSAKAAQGWKIEK
jgi:hypothetical protein